MTETVRTFIALKIPSDLAAAVGDVQRFIKTRAPAGSVRWTRLDHLHLTLMFLGNVALPDVDPLRERIRAASARTAALSLELCGVGCFPDSRNPRVIWVGVGGEIERLRSLQAAVEAACSEIAGHEERREFSPHLTIGRIKPGDRQGARVGGAAVEAFKAGTLGRWLAATLHLVRSDLSAEGPRYTDLAEFPLADRSI